MSFDLGVATGMTNGEIASSIHNAPIVHIGIDSLTAGSGASSYNTFMQNYLRGSKGFGGLYVPFASFMEFAPNDYSYNLAVVDTIGSGRKWVDDLPFTDPIKVNSINGLGVYFDGTQPATGGGFAVYMKFRYKKIRLFYRQQVGGGTFEVDQPTYGQSLTVDTNGDDSLQYVDVELYRDDTVSGVGTITNSGYNLRINNCDGVVQLQGVLILTGDTAPVIVNTARAGRKLEDYVATNQQMRTDFLVACGVTHSLFNAGTNDAGSGRTPAEFEVDLQEAISTEVGAVKNVTVVIPNSDATGTTTPYRQSYLDVASANGASVYDIPTIWGDYATFDANGWMIDFTHPNDFFNRLLGQSYSNLITHSATYEEPVLLEG